MPKTRVNAPVVLHARPKLASAALACFATFAAAGGLPAQEAGTFGAMLALEHWSPFEYTYEDEFGESGEFTGRIGPAVGYGARGWYSPWQHIAFGASFVLALYGDVQGIGEVGLGTRATVPAGGTRLHGDLGLARMGLDSSGLRSTLFVLGGGVSVPFWRGAFADLSVDLRTELSSERGGRSADIDGVLPRVRIGLGWEPRAVPATAARPESRR